MKVSIVCPNYNGMKFLKTFLNSLNLDSNYIGELIIVDNGSSDDSINFINQYSENLDFPISIIENKLNNGFAKAVNQGIKIAKYPYILSLNNDTEIEKGAILALINCLESDDNIFSVSSKMIQFNNRNLIDDAGDEYNILGWSKRSGFNQNIENYDEKREIFSSCAGAALYRKSILDKIGLFDENFFAYVEDIDLAYRAQIYGIKNYYCPKAIVYHIGSGTSGSQYNEFKVKISARNNIWLVYKNLPIPQKIINFIFLFIGFLIKYIFFIKKGFGKYYIEGIKEGLNNRKHINKVKFEGKNTKNYFKIEWKLIVNTIKFLK